MCPHCVAAGIGAVVLGVPALLYLKNKLVLRKKAEPAQK